MRKTKIGIILALIMIIAIIATSLASYANNEESIYVNLTPANSEGIGYGIGDPTNEVSGQAPYIWNINTYTSSAGTTLTESQRNLYCIKANYGNSWETAQNANPENIVEYNLSYNLPENTQELLSKIQDDEAGNLVKELLNSETGKYNEILWLLDNFYIEGITDKEAFLDKTGIAKDEDGYYNKETGKMYDYELTDEDIKAVQKVAIWYFTNGEQFDKTDADMWLNITTDNGQTYKELAKATSVGYSGEHRNLQANIVYNYLVTEAEKNADYESVETSLPANVNTVGLSEDNGKYVIPTNRLGENYLIGPIVIQKNNELGYDIEIIVTDEKDEPLEATEYLYTDKDGNQLQNITSQKDLVGIDGGFYISVLRSSIEAANIKVRISYDTTPKKLWLSGTEDAATGAITLDGEQPLIEVTQDPQEVIVELTSKPQEFDLALRKYITSVNETNVTNLRTPIIEESTLLTGTTATYKHRKDPVVVEDKDEVTYNITIYNEGNKEGYATKIIDQLPIGLVNSTNNTTTVMSKDKNGNDKNTYKLSYNSTLNQIILEIVETTETQAKSLQPYTIGNLDYETLEIKCMVAQEADTKNQIILTNVAWIAAAYDSESQKEISAEGTVDRDSEPQTSPSVSKENMENYKGNDTNKEELADSEFFYQGQQEDDDFEKIVIMPIEKKFDLALFKHIAAVSKDPIIENGEYVTDTGNIDGTYLRAPVVKAINSETGKITYQQDDKTALTVEPGNYVLYTMRVYNEGEIDGYASKIKDTLPIGLEFVIDNEEYNGIWKLEGLDEDGRQVVSTTWYAKGQGAELNAIQGDENYKANLLNALNKEGLISGDNPDFIDAQVLCKVVEQASSDRVLVNYAQISDDSDGNGDPIDDVDSTPDEWEEDDDDQDIERIQLQYFDLSLRKFVTSINGVQLKDDNGNYIREPVVDVSNLVNRTGTTAIYKQSKQPLAVKVEDKIVYTIRVYNEGNIKGYASEVTDYLPPYLTYVENSEINTKYGWKISQDGRIITTTYLADKELNAFNGIELDYADLEIECIVSDEAPLKENQTNIAEISKYTYNGGTAEKDIDSTANNIENWMPTDEKLPSYKDEEINNSYVSGSEDDDDFEKVYVKEFDLALRKFITQIQDRVETTREPQVKIENGTITYEHSKDALTVHVGDVVIYTLRVYNEGEIDGFASEITDDIPEYLEYLPEDSTNVEYMWKMYDKNNEETDKIEDAVKLKTQYLSKENGEGNLIKAFDGENLSYKDVKIAFKVKDPNLNTYVITNYAQISDDSDENGNPVIDKDSTPDEWIDNEQHKDDDQDIENIKVQYFDLSLLKFVSKVIVLENGKETITETGYNGHENPEPVVKVELHKKELNKVKVKFVYGITVTNEGDIPGYATEITDYVPEGLKFEATDNQKWTDEGNNVISTKQLENTLLQPGQSETIEVTFTWINGKDNLSLKTNTAEISEDKNEFDVPDKDSTPNNKQNEEDDIDIAKVILSISTGAAQTYFMLTLGLLTVIATGVALIKKFVL